MGHSPAAPRRAAQCGQSELLESPLLGPLLHLCGSAEQSPLPWAVGGGRRRVTSGRGIALTFGFISELFQLCTVAVLPHLRFCVMEFVIEHHSEEIFPITKNPSLIPTLK